MNHGKLLADAGGAALAAFVFGLCSGPPSHKARSFVLHRQCGFGRRVACVRAALDSPRGPAASHQRNRQEERPSVPVVLYFLQHDFFVF